MAVKVGDLNGQSYADVAERFRQIRDQAKRTQTLSTRGKGFTTESKDRILAKASRISNDFRPRRIRVDDEPTIIGAERLIGSTNDIQSIEFLEMGILAKNSVGRIEGGAGTGSGFLVGEGLLLTNHHVLKAVEDADDATVVFGDEDGQWKPNPIRHEYAFDRTRFFYTDPKIDMTLVAVANSQFTPEIADLGFLPLIALQGKAIRGDALSIIHHPEGGKRSITVFNGILMYIENEGDLDPYFWHSCDTMPGSSGSPVFNARWEVVGLHRRGVPNTDKNGNVLDRDGKQIPDGGLAADGSNVDWIANEAVRASRIVKSLQGASFDDTGMADIRDRLLALWNDRLAVRNGLITVKPGFTT